MESRFSGAFDGLIEIAESREREEMLGYLVLDPCGGAKCIKRVAGKVALLNCLRILHNLPTIAGKICAMDDENSDSSAPSGVLVLVSPAAVVGEGLPIE